MKIMEIYSLIRTPKKMAGYIGGIIILSNMPSESERGLMIFFEGEATVADALWAPRAEPRTWPGIIWLKARSQRHKSASLWHPQHAQLHAGVDFIYVVCFYVEQFVSLAYKSCCDIVFCFTLFQKLGCVRTCLKSFLMQALLCHLRLQVSFVCRRILEQSKDFPQ